MYPVPVLHLSAGQGRDRQEGVELHVLAEGALDHGQKVRIGNEARMRVRPAGQL